MTRRTLAIVILLSLAGGTVLRTLWLRADPPVEGSVGIVWHDEGVWVHNARNKVLWGVWRTDEWNPVFIAPVFTALEYTSFELTGVGIWQARLVPVLSGLVSVVLLTAGLNALSGRRAAALGCVLLSTNYVYVMWNRAALMESTMTSFIVVAWAAYALAERRAAWGAVAGAAAVLAWFSKAAAAFFLAALAFDACLTLTRRWWAPPGAGEPDAAASRRPAMFTLAGLAIAAAILLATFVLPHWSEYRFYNWQMTVTRKPDYTWEALLQRASWLPVVQGFFSRMWLIVLLGAVSMAGIAARWHSARPAERLLVWWMLIGLAELTVHDSGNERRYVMFIPALVALTASVVGSGRPVLPADLPNAGRLTRIVAVPLLGLLGYLVIGSLVRLLFLDDVLAGRFSATVRISALSAAILALAAALGWRRLTRALAGRPMAAWAGAALVVVSLGWNLYEYANWARRRTDVNYRASVAISRLLPPGTLVQGKLANGLSLENRIRPLFVGNGFGNYADRFDRDDARYILTYDLPEVGIESSRGSGLIQSILDRYPQRRIIATFDVDETPGPDRAVLIAKFPGTDARD